MSITFYCHACKGRMKVPNEYGGKRGKCAHCQALVTIPPPPTGFGTASSGSGAEPIKLTESSERELMNSLAPATDQGPPELEHERLDLERARLDYDRRKLERERRELVNATATLAADEPRPGGLADGGVRDQDEIECPACCEMIKSRAKVCKHCGMAFGDTAEKEKPRRGRSQRRRAGRGTSVVISKSPGIAAVLAFFFPGLGHIYAGKIAFGLAYMILVPLLLVVPFLVGVSVAIANNSTGGVFGAWALLWLADFCLWVWQMVDAYNTVNRATRGRWG